MERSYAKGRQAEIPTTRDDPAIGRWGSLDPLAKFQPDMTPYHYTHNNPLNRIDPTGMLDKKEEDEKEARKQQQGTSVLSSMANSLSETVENLPSFIYNGTAQALADGKKTAIDVTELGLKVTSKSADIVSDAATGIAIVGLVLALFTDGASLALTEVSLSVGTGADLTSTLAKGADAAFFDGSSEAFQTQLTKTVLNIGSGSLLNSLTSRVVTRTGLVTGFRSAQSGRFVTNLQGLTTTAVRDATKIAIGFGY